VARAPGIDRIEAAPPGPVVRLRYRFARKQSTVWSFTIPTACMKA
jgi:hypothetical protein